MNNSHSEEKTANNSIEFIRLFICWAQHTSKSAYFEYNVAMKIVQNSFHRSRSIEMWEALLFAIIWPNPVFFVGSIEKLSVWRSVRHVANLTIIHVSRDQIWTVRSNDEDDGSCVFFLFVCQSKFKFSVCWASAVINHHCFSSSMHCLLPENGKQEIFDH